MTHLLPQEHVGQLLHLTGEQEGAPDDLREGGQGPVDGLNNLRHNEYS